MKYLILVICMLFLMGCLANVRQSIGISTNPLSSKMD